MLLLLVRHAVTAATGKRLTGWLPGHHLSPRGRKEAEAVAGRLEPMPVAAIYSSPLERCAETAEVIAARHKLRVRTLKEVGEVHYGQWQGKTYGALYRGVGWKQLVARPADFRFPGGETIREAQTRGMKAIETLLAKHPGEAVVVVSHADLIRLVVAGYIGLGLDLYQRMTVGPASVTALLLGDRIPRLLRLGDSGTLEDLGPRLEEFVKRSAEA